MKQSATTSGKHKSSAAHITSMEGCLLLLFIAIVHEAVFQSRLKAGSPALLSKQAIGLPCEKRGRMQCAPTLLIKHLQLFVDAVNLVLQFGDLIFD